MKMTFEEFRMLPMQYTFGLNTDAYCARKYVNPEHKIVKEVITYRKVKGDIYSGFKKPKVSFYKGNDGQIFNTARELWEHEYLTPWFTEGSPIRVGYYETDREMLFWTPFGWLRNQGDAINVLPPQRWRGMREVLA